MKNCGRRALVRWPSCLKLTARTSATNYFNRPFHAFSENVFIRADIVSSTLETFCLMGYVRLLYLLTVTDDCSLACLGGLECDVTGVDQLQYLFIYLFIYYYV